MQYNLSKPITDPIVISPPAWLSSAHVHTSCGKSPVLIMQCCLWVIPCQINAENGQPPQISTKLGLQVELNLLAHSKFWPPKLCGFYFTALRKLDFSSIFAVPDHTKQTVFSFLLHLHRHFLYKSVAYEEFSYVVEQD